MTHNNKPTSKKQHGRNRTGIRNIVSVFQAKAGTTYVIKMDPQNDKIFPVENDRFKDPQGKPIKRYECKITHVNNGRQQLWDTSKTTCQQIIEQLKKGFTVLKVTRHGEDRTTTYTIEGVQ